MIFTCSKCGEVHDDLPDIGFDKPDHWWDVPENEREKRIELTENTCIIDNEHFFIRGVIEIPVHSYEHRLGFGVWISQKKENFYTYLENPDSNEIGPFFGWLCNEIGYNDEKTLLLKTTAHFRGGNSRPLIEVESTEHPLSIDQQNGISLEKAWKIVHFYLDE
ncbi:MAG TPA: DUF2199 domain-containing protein [Pyrinomonadaceae bacterium]|jgi:hypothetical protein